MSKSLFEVAMRDDVETVKQLLEEAGGQSEEAVYLGEIRFPAKTTALMVSACFGSLGAAKVLLEKEKCLQNAAGETALLLSIKHGHLALSRLLIPEESKIPDNMGQNALMWAVRFGRNSLINRLLFLTGQPDAKGYTSLHHAVQERSFFTLNILKKYEAGRRFSGSVTALMKAAQIGNLEAVELLSDAECTLRDDHGRTALMHAIQNRNWACALLLVECEAGMQDNFGLSALMYCTRPVPIWLQPTHDSTKFRDVLEALLPAEHSLRDRDGNTSLISACKAGNWEVASNLMGQATQQNEAGQTALMMCAQVCLLEGVTALRSLELGMRDASGYTALVYGVFRGNLQVVQLLLDEAGVQAFDGRSALYFAVQFGHHEIIKLLEAKELPLIQSVCGEFLGHFLAAHDCVILLQKTHPYQLRKHDQFGLTPLIHAIKTGAINAIKYLAPYEYDMPDTSGKTPLEHAILAQNERAFHVLFDFYNSERIIPLAACKCHNKDILRTLLKHRYSLSPDPLGRTWQYFAAASNNRELIEVLQECHIISNQEMPESVTIFGTRVDLAQVHQHWNAKPRLT